MKGTTMFDLITASTDLALSIAPASVPDVTPDTDSPFALAGLRLVAIILGICFIAALLALAGVFTILGFKGFGNSALLDKAGSSVIYVVGALIGLGSLTGIAGFFIGFKIF